MYYSELRSALEDKPREMTIHGKLFQGLGEGAYYIDLPGYKRQFIKLLGFEPFPGTLNLRLTSPLDIEQKRQLRLGEGLTIEGFENGTRTYGGARCYSSTIAGKYPAAVLLIDRTHYDDGVLELISPLNLRKELGLKNGDDVEVRVSFKN
jgi:riboflavin kinase